MDWKLISTAPKNRRILAILNFSDGYEREVRVIEAQKDKEWPWRVLWNDSMQSIAEHIPTHWTELGELPE